MRGGPRIFRLGFTCPGVLWIPLCRLVLRVRGARPLRPAFPKPFPCTPRPPVRSEPRGARAAVWAPPVPLAATPGIDVSFSSSGYLDVSVRRVPLRALWIHARMRGSSPRGFPHSETCGSTDMCSSPQLFAAYRVFHRLLVPGHPPCALSAWPVLPRTHQRMCVRLLPPCAPVLHGFRFYAFLHPDDALPHLPDDCL